MNLRQKNKREARLFVGPFFPSLLVPIPLHHDKVVEVERAFYHQGNGLAGWFSAYTNVDYSSYTLSVLPSAIVFRGLPTYWWHRIRFL